MAFLENMIDDIVNGASFDIFMVFFIFNRFFHIVGFLTFISSKSKKLSEFHKRFPFKKRYFFPVVFFCESQSLLGHAQFPFSFDDQRDI